MKACTYPRHWKRSQETRGQRHPLVATMTSTRESLIRTYKQRVEGLRKDLLEAEQAKAAGKTAVTMHHVAAVGQGPERKLGPTVFAELMVNGVPVQALIHTGLPATIISLDCAMQVLARDGRKEGRTDTSWKGETLSKFAPPEVNLKSYRGQRLSMIAQISLCLTQDQFSTNVTFLVQKEAPNDLLLGTDIQPLLGFAMVMKKAESTLDLFSGREWECGNDQRIKETPRVRAQTSVVGLAEFSSGGGGCASGKNGPQDSWSEQ